MIIKIQFIVFSISKSLTGERQRERERERERERGRERGGERERDIQFSHFQYSLFL